jgi:hypothetical protein
MAKMQYIKIVLLVATLGLGVATRASGHSIDLWIESPDPCRVDPASDLMSSCIVVKVDSSILQRSGVDLRLKLPRNVVIQVSRVHAGPLGKDGYIWEGVVQGASYSDIVFSIFENVVVGSIDVDDKMYRLRLSPNGDQVVEELEQALLSGAKREGSAQPIVPRQPTPGPGPQPLLFSERLNCYHELYPEDFPDNGGGNAPDCPRFSVPCETDSPNLVDVMVLYTPNAANAGGGPAGMTAWIYLQLFLTNRSFTNSNLALQARLAHRAEIVIATDAAGKDFSNESNLKNLTRQCDGELELAHTLRDTYKADVVMLLTRRSNVAISGMSNHMLADHVDDGDYVDFAPCAFGVVDAGVFMSSDYTFAHELGHVMGAQHNYPADAGAKPASSFGYMDESPSNGCQSWMTIMAARGNSGCDDNSCRRVPLWSNVDTAIKYCGEPLGNASAKNRDTLAFTARTVANFRCGSTPPGNVWMKDTWEDTGAEPDQATVSQQMWKSPYIWVRRAQDPEPMFEGQHISEWPVPNQVNYVYVKVHNGGGPTSGKLELWKAQIGTGTQWPSSFSLVGTKNIDDFNAHSMRIVEFPWTPDSKSYGFVARWSSPSDPMAQTEVSDVEANARANNNVVSRNVSVVELLQDRAIDLTTVIQNVERNPERVLVLISPGDPDPKRSLFDFTQATIRLDRELMAGWKQGGYQGTGFRRTLFRGIQITNPRGAILDGIVLKPGLQSELSVTIRGPRTPNLQGSFVIDVLQKQQSRLGLREVGGATFEVRAGIP